MSSFEEFVEIALSTVGLGVHLNEPGTIDERDGCRASREWRACAAAARARHKSHSGSVTRPAANLKVMDKLG